MIGLMEGRVELLKRRTIDNERGGFAFDYESTGTMWAYISPMSQQEIQKYREYQVETNVQVLVRYHPSNSDRRPQAGDRLLFKDMTIDVTVSFDTRFSRDYLEILGVTHYES